MLIKNRERTDFRKHKTSNNKECFQSVEGDHNEKATCVSDLIY